MAKVFSLLFFVLSIAWPQQIIGMRSQLTPRLQQADRVLQQLVSSHPEQGVNKELWLWIDKAEIFLSFQASIMPKEMRSELIGVNGKPRVVLVVNPDFLLGSTSFNLAEDRKYKQLVVYHEYIHIADHMKGEIPLMPPFFRAAEVPKRSKNIWDSEWSATLAEWKLAKKMDAALLMPRIYASVQKFGEEQGFLEGFYELMKENQLMSRPEIFLPYWEKYYRAKKIKFTAKPGTKQALTK